MKKFSRILSILLILSMLLSLAPAVFAAETVTTEDISVPSTHRVDEEEAAIKIPTYVTLPANYSETANYPLVVLIHGHGGNHNEWGGYDAISNGLAAEDFVVVTLDFSGCGASDETFLLNTMTNMKNDVVDVLNYVTENYAVDETKVGAMGYSMGGRIVLELVAEELYDFATIELVAPGEDLENLKVFLSKDGTNSQDDKTYEEHKAEAEANGYTTFTSPFGSVQTLSKEFFADLEKYPDGLAEAAAEKYDGEAMVIWSSDDWVIDPTVSETTANILGAVKLPVFADGHSYGFYGTDSYTNRLTYEGSIHWFIEELKNEDEGLVAYVSNIQKYGHLDLNITGSELLEHFTYGDIITAEINGKTFDLPVCTNYTDVDDGELLVRVVIDESAGKNTVTLAINYGKLAVESGVGYATTDAYGNTVYLYNDIPVPVVVKLSLKEAGGYYEDWLARQLPARTNVREDYADLSDEEFANFRNIATTGMGKDVLYRSSSPVNPEIGRNTYADAAAEAAGVKTFVNLADSEAGAAAYEGFADTYYSTQNVIYLNLAANFQAEDFKAGLAQGLRFMAANEGPYLFHCNEGKDRAGFTAAILECFMGASYDEVIADYMVTYYNYYGIEPGTEKYTAVANSNIVKSLVAAFGVEDLAAADLQKEAVEYLTEIGLTAEEQTALAENLSTSYGLANEDEIVIYYTNDIHTYINKNLSYDNIADLKQQTAEQAAGVLLIDAGDHIQGTAYGSMDKGETIIKLMNAAGYDLATLGNHEFDYDMDRILEIIENEAQFPYISANFYHEENGVVGDPVLEPYKIYTFGDTKIAIIGITTPESFTKSTPKYFQDDNGNYIYGIAGGEDGAELYAAVQKAIDEVKDEVDYVIALGHCGDDPASQPWTSEEVIANTTGLDAFIDGHSHSTVEEKKVLDKDGRPVVLTQTGEYFNAIGKMTITADGIKTELIKDYNVSDAAVKAIKDEWLAEVDTLLGEKIAASEVDFTIYDEDGTRLIRKQETNLGDYCADALYYLFSETEGLKVDAAIMNGGGIRADMPAGDISYKTTKTVHTFGNVACLITVTGQQILDALEWGAKNVGVGESGGFLQVSGITYEIHTYIESTVQADDKGVWIGGPTGEYRVKNVTIGGEPLDVNATYNLAGYNYTLRDLGDGFAMFDGAANVKDYVMEDYLVLANYAKSFPVENGIATIKGDNSVLGADYSSIYGEGRITIVTEGETISFSDVEEGKWYYEWVMKAAEAGYIVGYEDGTFQPNKNVTRAEFAQMIYAACGSPELPEGVTSKFTDVTEGKWYYEPVTLLAAAGVIAGRTETTFDPNATITRQEMVAILYRLYKLGYGEDAATPDLTVLEKFSDSANISAYAKEAFAWAIEAGVISGMGNGTLAPKGYTTRAQAAVVIVKCGEI